MATPTIAETRPMTRRRPSGMSRAAAMARLVPNGKAANRMPSIAKNRPIAARKSNIGANSSYGEPGAGGIGDAGGGAARKVGGPRGGWPPGGGKKREKTAYRLRNTARVPRRRLFY